jgi:hypothetical protein
VGTLIKAARARDLLPNGIRAMEHATACFAGGQPAIPDQHGNFFIAALTGALDLYSTEVPAAQASTWRERMKRPRRDVVAPNYNNWETYVMKGEWMRVRAGLADRKAAIAAIEDSWNSRQHARIAPAPWFLYHDRSSEPDTLSVEAVGRGNLLALAPGLRWPERGSNPRTCRGWNALYSPPAGPVRPGPRQRPHGRSYLGGYRLCTRL